MQINFPKLRHDLRSPHLYMSPSSHCDDIKAMNNFLPTSMMRSRRSRRERNPHRIGEFHS
ncbi:hypothetical protein L9F63_013521, partial [Diploptera punctata]